MTRVLITGASGFLGRACVPRLAERAEAIHAVTQRSELDTSRMAVVSWHQVDLHDSPSVARLLAEVRPTHLLHLAWNAVPGEFWTTPQNLDWVAASLHLARRFAEHGGQRLVVAGSCAEYAPSEAPLHEARSPCRPQTLYGASKYHLRGLLETFCPPAGVSLAWARLFGLYGPGEHPRRIVASTVETLLNREPVRCTAGTQARDFLHVRDAATALVELLFSPLEGPVNIASGQAITIANLITGIAGLIDPAASIEFGSRPLPAHEPPRVVADVTRLRRELGWSPARTLEEGVAQYIHTCRKERRDGRRAA